MYKDDKKISNSILPYYILLIYLRYAAEKNPCLVCVHMKNCVWEW